jgi:NhaP-type Na+/H+ or K+/H+ antiporter
MIASLAIIILAGMFSSKICKICKLPSLIGLLIIGCIIGPSVLGLLDDAIISISSELKHIALIIIIIKAGFSINLSNLKKIGKYTILISLIPSLLEIMCYGFITHYFFNFTFYQSLLLGTVVAAVSPAIVIPKMVSLIEDVKHKKNTINPVVPEMLLTGCSLDNIFVIALFSCILNLNLSGSLDITGLAILPLSLLLSIVLGFLVGKFLTIIFERQYKKNNIIRNTNKTILLLGVSFLFAALEDVLLKNDVTFSSLLAIIALTVTFKLNLPEKVTTRLNDKIGKIWIFAEIILFVLLGSQINFELTYNAGTSAIILILVGFLARFIGMNLCLFFSKFSFKERLFCSISYLPKASVQAAIGSIPLSLGIANGDIILSLAVLSIIVTAPLAGVIMDFTYKRWFYQEKLES